MSKINIEKLRNQYPISGKLEGWFFRIEESSAGVYKCEGKNIHGMEVSKQGIDDNEGALDNLLSQCIEDAKSLQIPKVATSQPNKEAK